MKFFQRVIFRIRQQVRVLYFAHKNPKLPLFAWIKLVLTLGYALSPIDLIPDFIPLLGYLDDLIILPVLIWISFKLIPVEILSRAKDEATLAPSGNLPKNKKGAIIIVTIWLSAVVLTMAAIWSHYG